METTVVQALVKRVSFSLTIVAVNKHGPSWNRGGTGPDDEAAADEKLKAEKILALKPPRMKDEWLINTRGEDAFDERRKAEESLASNQRQSRLKRPCKSLRRPMKS